MPKQKAQSSQPQEPEIWVNLQLGDRRYNFFLLKLATEAVGAGSCGLGQG